MSRLSALLFLLLAGCASTPPPDSPAVAAEREQIVMSAFAQVGKAYRYGGNGPEAFDCSGLVRYVYSQAGLSVPRTTASLYQTGVAVADGDLRPADLLFYRLDAGRSGPSHVMVYLGEQEALHAPSTGGAIRTVKIDLPIFQRSFVGARRLLN